jgi:CheY-like chemotaxis protein
MAKRRVLIVDDSKTAQVRLRKMLERFEVEVDTVNSAEEALGYLSYRQPSVIFLDHHMEGMDGLAALKIIKANPGTALIPVIMYTSEQGDVYVGQARALGALDIISKEVIKQANLEKVLNSLNIYLVGTQPPEDETHQASIPTIDMVADLEETPITPPLENLQNLSDLSRVQQQISRLFEIHIAKVRQEIEDSTKFLMRRLSKEIQEKAGKPYVARPVTPVASNTPSEPLPPIEVESGRDTGISTFLLALILLGVAFLGYHLYINNQHMALISQKYDSLEKNNQAQEDFIKRLFEKHIEDQKNIKPELDGNMMLETLSWAANLNNQVGFGEQALDDQRIYALGEMLSVLKAANFKGTVYLDIYLGNFCVIEDPSGRFMLPEPESNLDDCVFLADKQPQVKVDAHISVGFLNYIHSAPLLTEGPIDLEFAMQAYSQPKVSYPAKTSATSAGQWNEVARKNNRIGFSFSQQ